MNNKYHNEILAQTNEAMESLSEIFKQTLGYEAFEREKDSMRIKKGVILDCFTTPAGRVVFFCRNKRPYVTTRIEIRPDRQVKYEDVCHNA